VKVIETTGLGKSTETHGPCAATHWPFLLAESLH
jgi:hypothetical protein